MKSHTLRKAAWTIPMVSLLLGGTAWAQPFLQSLVTNNFAEPYGVAVATNQNFYITDSAHNRIVTYNPDSGALTNLAGSATGAPGSKDGPGVFSSFYNPQGIVFSAARGGLVVADSGNHTIRFVALDGGVVSTIAGKVGSPGSGDGAGTAAQFNAPAGVEADSAGNIYVADLLNNKIRKIDLANNVTTVATGGFVFNRPSGVALNKDNGDLYVAETGTHSIRVVHPNGTVDLLAGSGSAFESGDDDSLVATDARFKAPRSVLWVGGKLGLLVSDTGNHLLRRVYFNAGLNTFSVERYGNFADGVLNAPIGMAIDEDGNFPLVDLGNNSLFLVRVTAPQPPVSAPAVGVVDLTTNIFGQLVTHLTAVTNSTFNNDVTVAILPETGTETFYTLDSNANFPDDVSSRKTPPEYSDGRPSFPASSSIINPANDGSNVTVRAFSTQTGRRPSPVVAARFLFKTANPVINGKNPGNFTMDDATDSAQLWYTTDGSSPVNGSPSSLYDSSTNSVGHHLNIVNGTNDVVFKVRAFRPGYSPSDEITQKFLFSDLQTSSIGLTRDFSAGIGSTIVVPVEVKLSSDDVLKSLQFRVEVAPVGGAPAISTQFRPLEVRTNDFIPVIGGKGNPVFFSYSTYTNGTTTGVALSFIGTESGLDLSGSATVALLAVPIPTTAAQGQTYTVSLVQPSGSSDGTQTPIFLTTFRDRQIMITNLSYVVGDTAVAKWYNAGDFGNTNLNNNDVNNAFHASLGLSVPFSFTDVFDAMDAFPEDSLAGVGGDGQIRFLDWQVILRRSLRLSTNNWTRSWGTGGVRSAKLGSLNASANTPAEVITGDAPAWSRQAVITAGTIENAAAGGHISVPLSISVKPGKQVAGLQFRVVVDPVNGAPPLDQPVQFVGDGGLPAPVALQGLQEGLPLNNAVGAWSLFQNKFSPALQNSQQLGAVDFTVPAGAKAGQSYRVHFENADGAPDVSTQYDFETLPGIVWIGTSARQPRDTISDEWKLHFFGSVTNALAQPDADPDGDGVPNSVEYGTGKSPVKLHLYGNSADWKKSAANGKMSLHWFAENGKQYQVESSSDLQNWSAVGTTVSGQSNVASVDADAQDKQPRFFRVRVRP